MSPSTTTPKQKQPRQNIILRLIENPNDPKLTPIITLHARNPFSTNNNTIISSSSSDAKRQRRYYSLKKPIRLKMLPVNIFLEGYVGSGTSASDSDAVGDAKVDTTPTTPSKRIPWKIQQEYQQKLTTQDTSPPPQGYQFSVLQSLIQKAMRRRDETTCLRGLHWMLLQDTAKTLRRLPVIMMEDALMHPDLPFLTWLMMACTRDYKISQREIQWIMQIVRDLLRTKWRDPIPHAFDRSKEISTNHAEWNQQWMDILESYGLPIRHTQKQFNIMPYSTNDNNQLLDLSKHLIKLNCLLALIIRINYGGMKGDQLFLHKQVVLWHRRFQNHPTEWFQLWQREFPTDKRTCGGIGDNLSEMPVPLSNGNHQQSYAIDFHNFPFLTRKLQEQFPQLSLESMKSAIWNHRSGLNVRNLLCNCNYQEVPSAQPVANDWEKEARQKSLSVWKQIQPQWVSLTSTNWFWKAPKREEVKPLSRETTEKKPNSGGTTLKRKRGQLSGGTLKKGIKSRKITDFFGKT